MFSYPPLHQGSDSLRLLTLLPKAPRSDEIECRLETQTFRSKPHYEALSYTWGTGSASHQIMLNGFPFPVRENLYNALKCLRRNRPRALWIDAVCINQGDVAERNAQVSLMAFIYTRAQKVVVWLGKWAEPVRNNYLSDSNWHALSHSPYWSRLWIIQELVLAKDIRFNLGNYVFDWEVLSSTMNPEWRAIDARRMSIEMMRDEQHNSQRRLGSLIEIFKKAQCAEKRDKIYGFLGMVNDGADQAIEVDYTITFDRLWAKMIDFHQNIDSLSPEVTKLRHGRLLHFSHLIQTVLGGAVAEAMKQEANLAWSQTLYTATAFVATEVLVIGPSLAETASSITADRSWKLSFSKIHKEATISKQARMHYETFSQDALRWSERKLATIGPVYSKHSYGHFDDAEYDTTELDHKNEKYAHGEASSPLWALGTEGKVGLVPVGTRVGDLLCTFHDFDGVIILRKVPDVDRYTIVGQARIHRDSESDSTNQDEDDFYIGGYNWNNLVLEEEPPEDGLSDLPPINLRLDLELLQKLTKGEETS